MMELISKGCPFLALFKQRREGACSLKRKERPYEASRVERFGDRAAAFPAGALASHVGARTSASAFLAVSRSAFYTRPPELNAYGLALSAPKSSRGTSRSSRISMVRPVPWRILWSWRTGFVRKSANSSTRNPSRNSPGIEPGEGWPVESFPRWLQGPQSCSWAEGCQAGIFPCGPNRVY